MTCSNRPVFVHSSTDSLYFFANLTGVGTLTGQTLSGTAYTVPTADFQSTVTVGGEQYIVSFKVTESPTGGNAVHSVDVARVPKPEFNAQYDKNVTANGNGGPTGTSPSLESGGGEGYNGSGERSADDWNETEPEGGPATEGAGDGLKRDELLNSVQNDKLRNAVNQIYRPNASVGDGGLGDAVRHEISTGELVGGKSHIMKAKERIKILKTY